MSRPLFLDANAGVPVLAEARAALAAALDVTGNPSSPHALGRAARTLLDDARDRVAAALACEARELTFTSGASEANRWLADAVARLAAERASAPLVVVTSPLEHPSLARPLARLAERGAHVSTLPLAHENVAAAGDDVVEQLARADVLFVTAAHNETGVLPPLAALLALVPRECVVCVDAAQWLARALPGEQLPARVDAVVVSAHKIGGVAGAGALVLRGNARALRAGWLGGGQEAGLRPGTEALALHAAFGAAAAVIEDTRRAHRALAPLRDRVERALVEAWRARPLGTDGPRLPNTCALVVAGADGDALRIAIDGTGVAVGFGSACSALAPEPSPALRALGLSDGDARATVRVSLPARALEADVDEAIARLATVAPLIDRSRRRRDGRR